MVESNAAANRASLERMKAVADILSDEELARPLGNGWTAAPYSAISRFGTPARSSSSNAGSRASGGPPPPTSM